MKLTEDKLRQIVWDCMDDKDRDLVQLLQDRFKIEIPEEHYKHWVTDENIVRYLRLTLI